MCYQMVDRWDTSTIGSVCIVLTGHFLLGLLRKHENHMNSPNQTKAKIATIDECGCDAFKFVFKFTAVRSENTYSNPFQSR